MADLQSSSPSVGRSYFSEDGIAQECRDGIAQECRDLMSSLPSEEGWLGNPLYQYQGFWYSANGLQGSLRCQKHFEAQDGDIFIVTTPKSGTTWLKALVFSLINRTQYPDFLHDHPLLKTSPHVLIPFMEFLFSDNKMIMPDLTSIPSPRLFSMHFLSALRPESMKHRCCKIVYMCRNPKDTLVSFWHYTNRLRPKKRGDIPIDKFFDMFCRGVTPYGPFWDHVLDHWRESIENPKRVLFLRYEEIREEPVKQLKKLAEFLECPFSEEEERSGVIHNILKLCSFDCLSNLDVTKTGVLPFGVRFDAFYRKGEVGDWKNYLTDEMERQLDKISEEKLYSNGLKFKVWRE